MEKTVHIHEKGKTGVYCDNTKWKRSGAVEDKRQFAIMTCRNICIRNYCQFMRQKIEDRNYD